MREKVIVDDRQLAFPMVICSLPLSHIMRAREMSLSPALKCSWSSRPRPHLQVPTRDKHQSRDRCKHDRDILSTLLYCKVAIMSWVALLLCFLEVHNWRKYSAETVVTATASSLGLWYCLSALTMQVSRLSTEWGRSCHIWIRKVEEDCVREKNVLRQHTTNGQLTNAIEQVT